MASPVKSVVANIDEYEEAQRGGEPMQDIYFLPVPMATYRALSNEAAKRNLTFAQLVSLAFNRALEK